MSAILEGIARGYEVPDIRPTTEWARDFIELPRSRQFTVTGKFDTSISRHLEAPINDGDDDRCRETNILAPVRGGKTLIMDIRLASILARNAGPTRLIFQDDLAAKDQAELRTWPIIEANECLYRLLPTDRHANRAQSIIFPTMPLHISGPSMNQLQSRGYQNIFADECWRYKPGTMQEIKGRLGDYVKKGTDKLCVMSQGGETGSEWDEQCARGVLYDWEFQCQSCGKYMLANRWTLKREDGTRWGMVWDKHKTDSGMWDIPKVLPTVRFECAHCGHPHVDTAKVKSEWNRTGRYHREETTKDNIRRTYHWTAVVDFPWAVLVENYLHAVNAWRMGNPTPLIQFFQKYTAEMKSENSLIEEMSFAIRATYEISSEWPDEFTRLMTIDRQDEDVYWWSVRAWSREGRSRRLGFGKAYGAAELEEIRDRHKVEPQHTLIDSGFRPKGDHGVYAICIRYGWVPVKGAAQENGTEKFFYHQGKAGRVLRTYSEPVLCDPEMGQGGQGARAVERIDFSSPTYADRVTNLIEMGRWEEPKSMEGDALEREYRKQMAAEFKKKITTGSLRKERLVWVCPSGNNHAFDLAKMQTLAATLLDILPDEIQETEAA